MKIKYDNILAKTEKAVFVIFSYYEKEQLQNIGLAAFYKKLWIPLSVCNLDESNKTIDIQDKFYNNIKDDEYCVIFENNTVVTIDMIFNFIKI